MSRPGWQARADIRQIRAGPHRAELVRHVISVVGGGGWPPPALLAIWCLISGSRVLAVAIDAPQSSVPVASTPCGGSVGQRRAWHVARTDLQAGRNDKQQRGKGEMHCVNLPGQRLTARDFDRQVAEFQVRAAVMNGFTALGIPVIEVVGQVCPGKGEACPSALLCNRANLRVSGGYSELIEVE